MWIFVGSCVWLRYLGGEWVRGKILAIRRQSMGINSWRHFREVIRIDLIIKTFFSQYLEHARFTLKINVEKYSRIDRFRHMYMYVHIWQPHRWRCSWWGMGAVDSLTPNYIIIINNICLLYSIDVSPARVKTEYEPREWKIDRVGVLQNKHFPETSQFGSIPRGE